MDPEGQPPSSVPLAVQHARKSKQQVLMSDSVFASVTYVWQQTKRTLICRGKSDDVASDLACCFQVKQAECRLKQEVALAILKIDGQILGRSGVTF